MACILERKNLVEKLPERFMEARARGFTVGRDLFVARCPERAVPGRTLTEMVGNDRVVGLHLKRLIDSGAFGSLKTTSQTVSSCAWATVYTGMDAGKHGVYDFFGTDFLDGSYFPRPGNVRLRGKPA